MRRRLGLERHSSNPVSPTIETRSKAEAQMASAGSNVSESRAEARARILNDLAKAEAEANLRREELTKATQRSSLQTLTAPTDGIVAQLAVHTIGGVVKAAKPIIVIVPKGGTLVVEVKLLNKDMGFVRQGQAVALKLEAFPFTRFGTVPGHVESISSDAVEDEKLGLVYSVKRGGNDETLSRVKINSPNVANCASGIGI